MWVDDGEGTLGRWRNAVTMTLSATLVDGLREWDGL